MTLDLAFNPAQPRDWRGRWALVGRAWQRLIDSNAGRDLDGLPGAITVNGTKIHFRSHKGLQDAAEKYNREHGLGAHPTDYVKVKPEVAERVAQAYDELRHDPQDPEVQEAYAALKSEVVAQYRDIQKAGFDFEFYPPGKDPYPSPRLAVQDLTQRGRMYVYPTVEGFGSDADFDASDNPMLERVPGLKWSGEPVTYNDVFRAVHDVFGHAKEGVGFRADGEDNAYRQHYAMFSPEARKVLATETRGQNSWLNFGPYGERNRTASTADTIFADQKVGILPEWARDPDIHKEIDMSTVYTPNCAGQYDFAKHDGKLAFWKQILPKKVVHYTAKDGSRQTVDFNDEYLTDLATSQAVDKIGFLLADKDNAHTMDPERWRGDVVQTEVREDGLYGKIVFPSPEAAAAVLANPDLPVSARIREGVSRSDGSTVRRGLIHVLGTLDPQVSGMSGWQATDLSNEGEDVLDLSNEEYEDMAKQEKKSLADYTEADIDAMTDEELDEFLSTFVPEVGNYTGDDEDSLDREAEADDEASTDKVDEAKELVGAGADMSKRAAKDIELANEAVAKANARANEAMRRVADAEWREERNLLLSKGVPPHVLDLAEPVLRRADDMVIDLSNSDEDDLDVTSIVRNLVKSFEGTVDLSNEQGHSGAFRAEDGEDPDKAMLDAWAAQS